MKINLGCGKKHKKGWLNVDRFEPADQIVDLATAPHWPWEASSVEAMEADNVLEHFDGDELTRVFNQAWRVLKRGAHFWIRVPNFKRWPTGAIKDFTHKTFFLPETFQYLHYDHQTYRNYGSVYLKPWDVFSIEDSRFLDVTMEPWGKE